MDAKEKKDQTTREQQATGEEELAAYDKFRQKVSKILAEFQEKINAENISQAMDRATSELREMGDHSKEVIAKAQDTFRKDMASSNHYVADISKDAKKTLENMLDKGGELWRDLAKESEYLVDLSRDKSGGFLANVARAIGEWSLGFGEKLDKTLTYKTGEITHGGEFACLDCEAKIHLKQPGRIPPCPKCRATAFRRS